MRDFYLPAFLLSLPPLAALGHDIYMAYNNTELAVEERFFLSDLGWLWTEYSPETFKWAKDNIDTSFWSGIVDPVLEGSAVYVLGAPLALLLVILLVLKIFGIGPYEGDGLRLSLSPRKKEGFSFNQGRSKGPTKYKRK